MKWKPLSCRSLEYVVCRLGSVHLWTVLPATPHSWRALIVLSVISVRDNVSLFVFSSYLISAQPNFHFLFCRNYFTTLYENVLRFLYFFSLIILYILFYTLDFSLIRTHLITFPLIFELMKLNSSNASNNASKRRRLFWNCYCKVVSESTLNCGCLSLSISFLSIFFLSSPGLISRALSLSSRRGLLPMESCKHTEFGL